ncbi:MAG: hypothetical protein GVY24_08245 [Planctomycetes bacterium]|nr:hypothetical protein [Planctomycetota bacterium]
MIVLGCLVIGAAVLLGARPDLIAGRGSDLPSPSNVIKPVTSLVQTGRLEPRTFSELIRLSPDDLEHVDIARMNLLCATGLPGAEDLDVEHALATLDEWAKTVAIETDRHLYRVTDPLYADHYRHSEAYFRAEFLLQVLQQDLGVRYDPRAIGNFSFADSRMAFIHGMIPAAPGETTANTPGGTCASMPVLYVAVGRRLGYPLKLVTTDSHLFVRWDGKDHPNPDFRGRFNIEGAGEGFSSFEDDYYRSWPVKVTEKQVQVNKYLVSLTPREELALFIAGRGHCAFDHGKYRHAARSYENVTRLDWARPAYRAWFLDAARRCDYVPESIALRNMLNGPDRHLPVIPQAMYPSPYRYSPTPSQK